MTRTPVNDFGDHYTNQLYYALLYLKYFTPLPCTPSLLPPPPYGIRGRVLNKHLIGVEPINNCFEGKRCTNSAKDVKIFILNQSLLYLSALKKIVLFFYKG